MKKQEKKPTMPPARSSQRIKELKQKEKTPTVPPSTDKARQSSKSKAPSTSSSSSQQPTSPHILIIALVQEDPDRPDDGHFFRLALQIPQQAYTTYASDIPTALKLIRYSSDPGRSAPPPPESLDNDKSNPPPPSIPLTAILLPDAGLPDGINSSNPARQLWTEIIKFAAARNTRRRVVVAAQWPSYLPMDGRLRTFFAMAGLRWRFAGHFRDSWGLNADGGCTWLGVRQETVGDVENNLAGLPGQYVMEATVLEGVGEGDRVYLFRPRDKGVDAGQGSASASAIASVAAANGGGMPPGEVDALTLRFSNLVIQPPNPKIVPSAVPAACTRLGGADGGWLGFVGDVNMENGSILLIMGMLGLDTTKVKLDVARPQPGDLLLEMERLDISGGGD